MGTIRDFVWPENASLRGRRWLLSSALLLASTFWFVLAARLAAVANDPKQQFLWGLFWIGGIIISLVFTLLLKTRQCQSAC
jgi:hypothetical protein